MRTWYSKNQQSQYFKSKAHFTIATNKRHKKVVVWNSGIVNANLNGAIVAMSLISFDVIRAIRMRRVKEINVVVVVRSQYLRSVVAEHGASHVGFLAMSLWALWLRLAAGRGRCGRFGDELMRTEFFDGICTTLFRRGRTRVVVNVALK